MRAPAFKRGPKKMLTRRNTTICKKKSDEEDFVPEPGTSDRQVHPSTIAQRPRRQVKHKFIKCGNNETFIDLLDQTSDSNSFLSAEPSISDPEQTAAEAVTAEDVVVTIEDVEHRFGVEDVIEEVVIEETNETMDIDYGADVVEVCSQEATMDQAPADEKANEVIDLSDSLSFLGDSDHEIDEEKVHSSPRGASNGIDENSGSIILITPNDPLADSNNVVTSDRALSNEADDEIFADAEESISDDKKKKRSHRRVKNKKSAAHSEQPKDFENLSKYIDFKPSSENEDETQGSAPASQSDSGARSSRPRRESIGRKNYSDRKNYASRKANECRPEEKQSSKSNEEEPPSEFLFSRAEQPRTYQRRRDARPMNEASAKEECAGAEIASRGERDQPADETITAAEPAPNHSATAKRKPTGRSRRGESKVQPESPLPPESPVAIKIENALPKTEKNEVPGDRPPADESGGGGVPTADDNAMDVVCSMEVDRIKTEPGQPDQVKELAKQIDEIKIERAADGIEEPVVQINIDPQINPKAEQPEPSIEVKRESGELIDNTNSATNSDLESAVIPKELLEELADTSIRRSGRIKTIRKSKQPAKGFGLVKDKKRVAEDDLSNSAIEADQLADKELPAASVESVVVPLPRVKTEAEVEQERVDRENGMKLFAQIVDNEYRSERTISKEAKKMACDCFLTQSEMERGELGCGDDCLNRMLLIECGPKCVVGDRCTNKRFQKHENAQCTIFKTEKKGYGLVATAYIPGGTFVMEYVGEVLNSKQFEKRASDYSKRMNAHYYFMALSSDCVIDATKKGNISRFINHSCDPNAETQKWTINGELRIGFFSKKPIFPDEEITFDYQFQRYG